MRRTGIGIGLKFGIFAAVMAVLTAFLFAVFGQYRSGSANTYSAVFRDVSSLKSGETVRYGGVRIGTVDKLTMLPDKTIMVTFDADREFALTDGTRAAVRYLNLVGDRYLELVDGAGSTRALLDGAQIPVDRTAPALDLDLLLGGLKPVIRGLNAQDVNALTASLIQIVQGQGGSVDSLLTRTSSLSHALADKSEVIQALIENLRTTLVTVSREGDRFSDAVDRLERLISGLADDRDPIGTAIESLNAGTASLTDLLADARPPLAGTVDQLNQLAPNLAEKQDRIETALQKAPENYRKLIRIGSYGSFVNYYICSLAVRVTDLQGRTAAFPVFKQDNGRCAET